MWCSVWVVGQVVFAFDPVVDGGEAHLVAVVCGGSLVVDDAERVVFGAGSVAAVFQAGFGVVDVCGGAFDGFLDKVGVQVIGFFAQVVVDGVFGFALASYAVFVGVAPRPVCGAVRAVLEFRVGGVEVALAVVGHVKADANGASDFPRHLHHSSG